MPDIGRPRKGEARDKFDRSKTKARLRVMLWTGLPQASLMRVTPMDVDLDRAVVYVRPRKKGRGAAATTMRLTPDGVEAFRELLRATAWGRFSTKSMAQSFHRAIARLLEQEPGLPIPRNWRPYDLRHTWLSYVLEVTGDERAVMQLAQHKDRRTTDRYVKRAQEIRTQLAIDRIADARRKVGA
jgi:integrase